MLRRVSSAVRDLSSTGNALLALFRCAGLVADDCYFAVASSGLAFLALDYIACLRGDLQFAGLAGLSGFGVGCQHCRLPVLGCFLFEDRPGLCRCVRMSRKISCRGRAGRWYASPYDGVGAASEERRAPHSGCLVRLP